MLRRFLFCLVVTGLTCLTNASTAQESLFFQGVNVFDGIKKIESTNVFVADGKIAAIGADLQPTVDCKTIDGAGKTLLPGMIDCHTHVWFDTHLQQAALFGVTTEMDMMSVPMAGASFRRQQAEGKANNRADFFSAGAAVTVDGGHGTQFGFPVPTLDKAENATQFVQDRIREGSDYIKLIIEDGSAYGMSRPTINRQMIIGAIQATHQNKKLAVAHVSTARGALSAIESDIDGLVHLFCDEVISDEILALAKSKGIFVAPTASVVSNASDDNMTRMIVNDEHLKSFLNNENLSNLGKTFPKREGLSSSWANLKTNILRLHRAGIPILAGTDSPNPGTVHGASMHHELRLLVEAGLTPSEALTAATANPAKHFQKTDRGRIAPGMRADLFLVNGDPTADIKNAARIVGVWKSGYAIDRTARMELVKAEKERANAKPVASDGKTRVISQFETKEIAADFGAGWSKSTDSIMGGNSTVEMKVVDGGADQSKRSLEVSGKTRDQQPAFSGVMFSPGAAQMQAADISANQSISFWAKGEGDDCQVMFFFQKRGFMPSMKTFKAEKDWTKYSFKISDFDGCDGTDVLGIWFGKGTPGEFKFQIDQVQLEK